MNPSLLIFAVRSTTTGFFCSLSAILETDHKAGRRQQKRGAERGGGGMLLDTVVMAGA